MRKLKFKAWDDLEKVMYQNVVIVDGTALRRDYFATDLYSQISKRLKPLQYTGLEDKDGVEIYEGDLLEQRGSTKVEMATGTGRTSPYWKLCEVVFHYGGFKLVVVAHHNAYFGELPSKPQQFFNIEGYLKVGNIYEHKNLLKENKDEG